MTKALIIEADFYIQISGLLRAGAISVLEKSGIEYDVVVVPGALEIPAALLFAVENNLKTYDCFVVLGCVIRGETSHYDIVSNESARGLYNLVLQYSLAVGNGILTVENEEQAIERADPQKKRQRRRSCKSGPSYAGSKEKIRCLIQIKPSVGHSGLALNENSCSTGGRYGICAAEGLSDRNRVAPTSFSQLRRKRCGEPSHRRAISGGIALPL